MSAACPLDLATPSSVAPVSAARPVLPLDAAVEEPGLLVLAALGACVDTRRLVCAVASVVRVAVGARVGIDARQAGERERGADAAERLVGERPHADDYEDVERVAGQRWTDMAGRASAELCRALLDEDCALLKHSLTVDAESSLRSVMWSASQAAGEQGVVDAFCNIIPWSELASAAAEVEQCGASNRTDDVAEAEESTDTDDLRRRFKEAKKHTDRALERICEVGL